MISVEKAHLGKVAYLYGVQDQDVMVVQGKDTEKHIPFDFEDVIKRVCFEKKQIVVDWSY